MDMVDDGGPAFPVNAHGALLFHGLTKRQWYAGMALQGMLANPRCGGKPEWYVKDSFMYADALIAFEDSPKL